MADGQAGGRDLNREVREFMGPEPDRSEAERAVANLRNPFVLLQHRISEAFRVPVSQLAEKKKSVKLALVSMPELPSGEARMREHWVATEEDLPDLDREACRRVLAELTPEFSARYARTYEAALRCAAFDHRADIICFNELGFPTLDQKPRPDTLALSREVAGPQHEGDRGRFVVGGSFHDRRTLYNTGGLFFPGCPPPGVHFHKQVSAVTVEERISVPPRRVTPCATVFGLSVAVLLCLDLADFAAVAGVVRAADWIDLALVPCYTEWTDDLERIARSMSRAMPGIVALVNYQRPGQTGLVITRFGETLTLRKPRPQPVAGACIHTLTLKVNHFLNEKLQHQSDMPIDQRMEWLFGRLNRPSRLP